MKIFAIKDLKIGSFTKPFVDTHEQNAIRGFEQVINDKQSMYAKYPEDFELWKIGSFNDESGKVEGNIQCLTNGMALQKQPEETK